MIEDKFKKNIDLSPLTTFRIGGQAKYFMEIEYAEELSEAVKWAKQAGERMYILGGGSNVLINDKGVNGLVIVLKNKQVKPMGGRIHCDSGASLVYTAGVSRRDALSGLEWAFGIPKATIGGAIRGNAGAFGQEMADVVETVEAFNMEKEQFQFFSKNDCGFKYRGSLFKERSSFIIWGATLRMKKDDLDEINSRIDSNMKNREKRQPKLPNAGSIFKNLYLEDIRKVNEKLAEELEAEGKTSNGKVGAGALIDMLGFKGRVMGGAKVSLEHANFIINTGKANARDVMDLMSYIYEEVKKRFKVELEPEIEVVGYE